MSTLADGIAAKLPGRGRRPLAERWLDGVAVVDEEAIANAMVLLMERRSYVEAQARSVAGADVQMGAGGARRRGSHLRAVGYNVTSARTQVLHCV